MEFLHLTLVLPSAPLGLRACGEWGKQAVSIRFSAGARKSQRQAESYGLGHSANLAALAWYLLSIPAFPSEICAWLQFVHFSWEKMDCMILSPWQKASLEGE